jgi:hypothetical protein
MVTYKSTRNRPVELGKLVIDKDTGVTLDTNDSVLDKLVVEGFLVSTTKEAVVAKEPATFKLFK